MEIHTGCVSSREAANCEAEDQARQRETQECVERDFTRVLPGRIAWIAARRPCVHTTPFSWPGAKIPFRQATTLLHKLSLALPLYHGLQ